MKKIVFAAGLAMTCLMASAQSSPKEYLVKTKNVKQTNEVSAAEGTEAEASAQPKEEAAQDYITRTFKYQSLCDWKPGMRFMVMPDKYDRVVKTFAEADNDREVSSVSLRHKIMVYQGHNVVSNGHTHINFKCVDDDPKYNNKNYYYEIPNGTFEDHCEGKIGVPTLAYLGDVDLAKDKLEGKTVYTKASTYCQDTESEGDGFIELPYEANQEVKITAVGVGTRSYPVKIIFEDKNGKEYFQNVALSKTNSGMRDDEFLLMGNYIHSFYGSFELTDAIMAVSSDIQSYIGKTIHTRQITPMLTRGDGKDRTVKVPKLTSFTVERIQSNGSSPYVTLALKELDSRRDYFLDVTFKQLDDVTGDIDGKKENYFGYLFAMGQGKSNVTTSAGRAGIRQGRVMQGMTSDEVILAMGEEPGQRIDGTGGRFDWKYPRSQGKTLVVHFGRNGLVESYEVVSPAGKKSSANRRKTSAKGKKK